jgi:hypothetical protein
MNLTYKELNKYYYLYSNLPFYKKKVTTFGQFVIDIKFAEKGEKRNES